MHLELRHYNMICLYLLYPNYILENIIKKSDSFTKNIISNISTYKNDISSGKLNIEELFFLTVSSLREATQIGS